MSRSVALPHGRQLDLARPLVMGIVNVTPDSFSDGGRYLEAEVAIAHARKLAAERADILDIGGESTRPGHTPVEADEELRRVLPVIVALAHDSTILSIDTSKARVAASALAAGASILNDVWGFQSDPEMARVAAEHEAYAILMHNRHEVDPAIDIMGDVVSFLSRSLDIALSAGVARDRIALDPGFGFGKTHAQSLRVVRDLPILAQLGFPIMLGVSRKRSIGWATGRQDVAERLFGTLACGLVGLERGASLLRVHDVAAHVDAIAMREAILDRGATR